MALSQAHVGTPKCMRLALSLVGIRGLFFTARFPYPAICLREASLPFLRRDVLPSRAFHDCAAMTYTQQMGKLRHREGKQPACGHTACLWQC